MSMLLSLRLRRSPLPTNISPDGRSSHCSARAARDERRLRQRAFRHGYVCRPTCANSRVDASLFEDGPGLTRFDLTKREFEC